MFPPTSHAFVPRPPRGNETRLPAGGYTVGPKPLIDLLRQRSRPYLFSNSLPPPVVGSATRAVELLLASNEIAQSMTAKTMRCVCVRYVTFKVGFFSETCGGQTQTEHWWSSVKIIEFRNDVSPNL